MLFFSKREKSEKTKEKQTRAMESVSKLKQMTVGKFCEWKPGMGHKSGRSLLIRGYSEKSSFVTCTTLSFGILMQLILICACSSFWFAHGGNHITFVCHEAFHNILKIAINKRVLFAFSFSHVKPINQCLSCSNTHAANGTAYPKNGMKNPATTGKVFSRSFLVCRRMGNKNAIFICFSALICLVLTNMFW